ncbi:hypothetical protein E2C01_082172 [Portunus trituberculatus]|uniref:Uncharacterized protein n=1 Tax=Portunus trituberculatus TaxID=210409 RepID=A0A5B7J461_PORTR|nr:hypothetical protein [Portunus trituberculatus]
MNSGNPKGHLGQDNPRLPSISRAFFQGNPTMHRSLHDLNPVPLSPFFPYFIISGQNAAHYVE